METLLRIQSSGQGSGCWERDVVSIITAFVFNACVTITVNALYIYSTQQSLGESINFSIQLSLSIFRLLYSVTVCPLLSRSILNPVDNVRFRFLLLTINNLVIPCVVTALTSDACFQGLLIPADSVSTPYSYRTCIVYTFLSNGQAFCAGYETIDTESASLVPPFSYNHQCGSVLLTSYIPVLLLGYSIQLTLPLVIMVALTWMQYDSVSPYFRNLFHGLLWPEHWLQGGEVLTRNKALIGSGTAYLLSTRMIFCHDVFNNLLLMLTFGLCSPVLAVAVVCCVLLKMSLWVMLIGRYARCAVESSDSVDDNCRDDVVEFALGSLADVYIPLVDVLAGSFWRLAWCSALFVAVVSWDMAMDEVGWLQSIWVPLVPLSFVAVLRCMAWLYRRSNRDDRDESLEEEEKKELGAMSAKISDVRESISPLHEEGL